MELVDSLIPNEHSSFNSFSNSRRWGVLTSFYRWRKWSTIQGHLGRGPNDEQNQGYQPGSSMSKPSLVPHCERSVSPWPMPALPSALPFASGSPIKPHSSPRTWVISTMGHRWGDWGHAECPESIFGIHYQQYNKQCLIAFDFQATRKVFPKLLLEHGPHLLSSGKQGPITHLLVNLRTFFFWSLHFLI